MPGKADEPNQIAEIDDDDATASVEATYHRLADCLGLGYEDAAHCLIGTALFALGEDLPYDEALKSLDFVRDLIDMREAQMRRERH